MATDVLLEQLAREYLEMNQEWEVMGCRLKARMRELKLVQAYLPSIPAIVHMDSYEDGKAWVESLADDEGGE